MQIISLDNVLSGKLQQFGHVNYTGSDAAVA